MERIDLGLTGNHSLDQFAHPVWAVFSRELVWRTLLPSWVAYKVFVLKGLRKGWRVKVVEDFIPY